MNTILWRKNLQLDAKDPGDIMLITFDWVDKLGSDNIISASGQADAGIAVAVESFDSSTQTLRISGGSAGVYYNVTAIIESATGQRFERSIIIPVDDL